MSRESHTEGTPALLLEALARRPTSVVPVWFMRQAGRSLPEYRALRGVDSILTVLRNPELAAEITLQPVHRYGVDAAILYSDIVAPLAGSDVGIDVKPGVGPCLEHPVRQRSDLVRLERLDPDALEAMAATVRLVATESPVPLIGFAGGPFTVASYLVEGRPSRDYVHTKLLMLEDPTLFAELLGRLATIALETIRRQAEAGASAIQLFDSWAGALAPRAFEHHVAPHLRRLADGIRSLGVPSIYFSVGTAHLLEQLTNLGFDALGVDWRVDLASLARDHGERLALQGNLDPTTVLASTPALLNEVRAVLRSSSPAQGYVFNLGHGVLPQSEPDSLARIVDFVHEHGAVLRRQALEEAT
jgi:uroporphyrinogen decarboxylase